MNNIKMHQSIVDYWFTRVDESDLSVDAAEALERCWRCGYEARLEMCHIIPEALGGEKTPENLVLLCKSCHLENPNVTDTEIMWDWLRAYKTSFYDTFRIREGLKEYEFMYGRSFCEEIKIRRINEEHLDIMHQYIKDNIKKTNNHYGVPHLNRATVAGWMRMVLKNWDQNSMQNR